MIYGCFKIEIWRKKEGDKLCNQIINANKIVDIIQDVSEFHRQAFRADSMIKNRHKTLNTYGIKNA
jgi:hypothetical protein